MMSNDTEVQGSSSRPKSLLPAFHSCGPSGTRMMHFRNMTSKIVFPRRLLLANVADEDLVGAEVRMGTLYVSHHVPCFRSSCLAPLQCSRASHWTYMRTHMLPSRLHRQLLVALNRDIRHTSPDVTGAEKAFRVLA